MASTIRIKRSGSSGSPSSLRQGELAYSYSSGTGGNKLYIGTGTEDSTGAAASIDQIGGKYFTDLLDHTPGTLTACLLYTSPSPRDATLSRMPSSA